MGYLRESSTEVAKKAAEQRDAFFAAAEVNDADGDASEATFSSPADVLQLPDGSLLISDTGNNSIRILTVPDTGQPIVCTIAAQGWLAPHGLALLSDGRVVVCDSGHNKLKVLDLSSGRTSPFAGSGVRGHRDGGGGAAQFNAPTSICCTPSGALLVSDTANHCIREVSEGSSGTRLVRTIAGQPGVAGHRDGALYSALLHNPSALVAATSATALDEQVLLSH